MCVLEIIWETIERNRTKKIKCIIKVWSDEKYLRELGKLFKYQHIYSIVEK